MDRMLFVRVLAVCLALGLAACVAAPLPTPMPQAPTVADKIANAMSAAPPAIAKDATILDWPAKAGDSMVVLRKGTNGWACYTDLPASPGNDPECNDPIAEAWFDALLAGKPAPPAITQPGIAYMLAGGSDPSNTDPMATEPPAGQDWINVPGHLMLIAPGKFDPKLFTTDYKSGEPWIMWAGTPYEHLMIPVVPTSAWQMQSASIGMQSAMSAAPWAVIKNATVYDWPAKASDPMVLLQQGTNKWTCYADFPGSPGPDPSCNDPEWMGWQDALSAGKPAPPAITQPGVGYMLAGGSDPSNTDPMATKPAAGEDWVTTADHMMLLMPARFDLKVFTTDHRSGYPYVMWAGTPYEHLMVPFAAPRK